MHPLDILLGTLAACPAIMVTGLVVNLVANNITTTRERAKRGLL